MIQNLINHIAFDVDKSGSMQGKPVVEVFDKILNQLKKRSVELSQETRISIYLFDADVECLAFDMDVMRFETLKGHYKPAGSTALMDAIAKSTEDMQRLPEMYGDHAFLTYILTDGEENLSRHTTAARLKQTIDGLKDNWTTACLVPNAIGVHEAKKFGIPAESISTWDTVGSAGLEKAAKQFNAQIDQYFTMRSQGVRSTRSFFTMDAANLKKAKMEQLPVTHYDLYPVRKEQPIKEFVESWTGMPYRLGSAYYMPVKTVKIQDHKNILVQDVKTGKVYESDDIRTMLGLPPQTVEVNPTGDRNWRVFVQSTSSNRKLYPDTFLLVRK